MTGNGPAEPVAVVGLGVQAPGAASPADLVETLDKARCLATPITDFAVDDLATKLSCRANRYEPERYFTRPEARALPRAVQLTVAAGLDAVGVSTEDWRARFPEEEMAIVVGTGIAGLARFEEQAEILRSRGARRLSPLTVPMIMPNLAAAELAIRVGSHAAATTVSAACASSSVAIALGVQAIRTGQARLVLAGGGESLITRTIVAAFARTDAMSRSTGLPRGPFDMRRDGFIMGEGAGFVLLAAGALCRALGVEPLGEILGVGQSTDAHHIVAPEPAGSGAVRSMTAALADAGLDPTGIGHVSAHATATPIGDRAEALAIGTVFAEHQIPVTSHKGVLGHLIGGAGSVSAIAAMLSAQRGRVPPIGNLVDPDPAIGLDLVFEREREIPAGQPALCNAFAFGGHNVSLIVR